ncbi:MULTISPECIES: hypothetical protein [unclassified Nonomuraea]|uniref:hypothetical protein n=1 Tax=unclassified Nonomuraea TaxID=2593643 RepID=UPI0033E0EEC0
MAGGFFIARVRGVTAPDPSRKDADGRPTGVLVTPPVTVTAYGPQDQVLRQEK